MVWHKVQLNRRSSRYGADEHRRDGIPSTAELTRGTNSYGSITLISYVRPIRENDRIISDR